MNDKTVHRVNSHRESRTTKRSLLVFSCRPSAGHSPIFKPNIDLKPYMSQAFPTSPNRVLQGRKTTNNLHDFIG
jgi:hypothetical protein